MKKLILLFALVYLLRPGAVAQSAQAVYQQFMNNQFKFPVQPNYDTIFVGTFDIQSGEFTGLKSIEVKIGNHWERRSPRVESIAKRTILKFSVKNYSGDFSVKVNGLTHNNSNNLPDIFIDVLGNKDIRWTITAGNANNSNSFEITRIPFAAAGVFRIPYLLVAIIYQPPKDEAGNNYTSYSNTSMIGTSVSLSIGHESAEQKAISPKYQELPAFKNALSSVAGLLNSIDNPYTSGAGSALTALSNALGSYHATQTIGHAVNNKLSFSASDITSLKIKSPLPDIGGPGLGDVFYCLRNCQFLWLLKDGQFYTTLLSTEGIFNPNASDLKARILQANDKEKSLLSEIARFDPFMERGTNTSIPQNRFVAPQLYSCVGTSTTQTVSHNVSQSDLNNRSSYSTVVEDYESGMLGSLGIGVGETKVLTTTVTTGLTGEISAGTTITEEVNLDHSNPCKDYWVYYDNLFGTFAVTDVAPPNAVAVYTGVYRDINGRPQQKKPYRISFKGKTFQTITDENGVYRFFSPLLKDYKKTAKPGSI